MLLCIADTAGLCSRIFCYSPSYVQRYGILGNTHMPQNPAGRVGLFFMLVHNARKRFSKSYTENVEMNETTFKIFGGYKIVYTSHSFSQ